MLHDGLQINDENDIWLLPLAINELDPRNNWIFNNLNENYREVVRILRKDFVRNTYALLAVSWIIVFFYVTLIKYKQDNFMKTR